MTGWTLVVCTTSGRRARHIHLGLATVAALLLSVLLVMSVAAAIGWFVGERQAQSALHGPGP